MCGMVHYVSRDIEGVLDAFTLDNNALLLMLDAVVST